VIIYLFVSHYGMELLKPIIENDMLFLWDELKRRRRKVIDDEMTNIKIVSKSFPFQLKEEEVLKKKNQFKLELKEIIYDHDISLYNNENNCCCCKNDDDEIIIMEDEDLSKIESNIGNEILFKIPPNPPPLPTNNSSSSLNQISTNKTPIKYYLYELLKRNTNIEDQKEEDLKFEREIEIDEIDSNQKENNVLSKVHWVQPPPYSHLALK